MREHGVLNRILLIYEEHLRRLDAKQDFDPQVLSATAGIVRKFVEDYHEKLEQDFLFPRFRKADRLVDLVDILYAQHQAGGKLTAQVQQLAVASTVKDDNQRRQLTDALHAFVRMYRPHEAREDTVLFPRFGRSFRHRNTTLWATTSRRKKTNCSEKKASSELRAR